jgi:hypothetical protein
MCHVIGHDVLCHLPCHHFVGKGTINVLLNTPCVMTGPLRRLSGRSARSLSGFKHDDDELEARRARLLAGVRRVHPLCCPGKGQARWAAQRTTSVVACRTATCVRAAALLHWSHDRISLASSQVAISSALFLLQSWLPRSPTVVAVCSSHHLLHVCFWLFAVGLFSCVLLLPLQSCAILFLFCSVILCFRRLGDCYAQRASETDKRQ